MFDFTLKHIFQLYSTKPFWRVKNVVDYNLRTCFNVKIFIKLKYLLTARNRNLLFHNDDETMTNTCEWKQLRNITVISNRWMTWVKWWSFRNICWIIRLETRSAFRSVLWAMSSHISVMSSFLFKHNVIPGPIDML